MTMRVRTWSGIALFAGLCLNAVQLIDDGSSPDHWRLEPSPAVQKHAFVLRDGAVEYAAGGSGQYHYSQLMRTDAATSERFGRLRFALRGDGSGATLLVTLYAADGTRWQCPVLLDGSQWHDVELALRDFRIDPHGSQESAGSNAWPDSRTVTAIGFLLNDDAPHQIALDDLAWSEPVAADRPAVRVEFYPATTHRGGVGALIAGQTLPLVIFAGDFAGVEAPVLELKLPEGVHPFGASITSNTAGRAAALTALPSGGWRIPLDPGVAVPGAISKFQESLNVFLTTDRDRSPGEGGIDWRIVSGDKEVVAGHLPVRILPPLPPVEAFRRQVRISVYTTILFASPDPELRAAWAKTLEDAGISGGVIYPDDPAPTRELADRGWRLWRHAFNWWDNWGVWASDLTTPPEETMAVLADGSRAKSPGALCPEWLLAHAAPEDEYYRVAREKLRPFLVPGMVGFLNDHEMIWETELSPRNSCFDARCIHAFAAFSGLPESELNAETILRQHRDAWFDFRYRQQGKLIGVYADMVQSLDPELKVAICSVPVTPPGETPIVPASYDAEVDEHWPMCYKSGVSLHRDIENTVPALRSPVTVLLNNCDPIGERVTIPPPEFELNLYGAMTSGARGVGIFTGDISLDGEYLSITNRVAGRTLPLEKWVVGGSRADEAFRIDGVPERVETQRILDREVEMPQPDWRPVLRSRCFRAADGSGFLVLAYNYSGLGHGLLTVAMPDGTQPMAVYDRKTQTRILSPSGRELWSQEELLTGIPVRFGAWDFVELEVTATPSSDWRDVTITPETIRQDWQNAAATDTDGIRPRLAIRREAATFPLRKVDGSGNPEETAEVTLRADAENLCVTFNCQDREVAAGTTGDDIPVWSSDCCEVFLSDGKNSYYHFGVNPAGGRYDGKDRDQRWNGTWQSTTARTADGWRAEFTIPWRTLNLAGVPAANFARENMPSGELSSLNPNGSDFHRQDRFLELDLPGVFGDGPAQ